MNKPCKYSPDLIVREERVSICGWPTDTLSIDHRGRNSNVDAASSQNNKYTDTTAHTIILFIPGNPGVIHWYIDSLARIIDRLGRGYAMRGVSYAGHGVGDDVVGTKDDHTQSFHSEHLDNLSMDVGEGDCPKKDMSVPWTMEGQIEHKIKWIEKVREEWKHETSNSPNLVFMTHSIGAHFVQCVLLRQPDILAKVDNIIHLTPFFRFDPPPMMKLFLSSGAHSYKYAIPTATHLVKALSSTLPRKWIDLYLDKIMGVDCTKGREIALDIFMNPDMVRNNLVLGMQEIRELPEHPNDVALRLIGNISPTSILFCGNDHWAPESHSKDLHRMQSRSEVPNNIHTEYLEKLSHDFVVHPEMIEPVVQFCVDRIESGNESTETKMRSRL